MHYTFDNKTGKFIPDTNYKQIGKTAFTVYTGSIIILDKVEFNNTTRKYTGLTPKGQTMTLKKSQILCMEGVC